MARPRMPRPGVGLAAGGVGLLSIAWLGMYAGSMVQGRWETWLVRMAVWVLGAAAAFLVFRLLPGGPGGRGQVDPIEQQLEQAREPLRAAGVRRGQIPLVVLLGETGSAKTTFVLQSGLEVDHLAGNLYLDAQRSAALGVAGPPVAPTEALNLWYHKGTLLVEVAGGVLNDAPRWTGLIRGVRPSTWAPAIFRRPQAPRVAVACFSVEELVAPGGADAVLAHARSLRDRLSELSDRLGIQLPVYVVFTKADAIPYFTEFVENFTEAETQEVLGATLRMSEGATASFKERESGRVRTAFDALYEALAARRTEVLSRTDAVEKAGPAYEFPREFAKITGLATEFLVELCRPSQLRVSPFLRGFYFTGVRPMEVSVESAPAAIPTPGREASSGATQMFSVSDMRAAAAPAPRGGPRRVPHWVFSNRVLRDVIFADNVAMGLTQGGTGLNALRRAALAGAMIVVLLLGIGVVVGQARDQALRRDVREAIAGVENVRSPDPALPAAEDLDRLERLRQVTERLSRYENGARPLRGALFLYSGGDLYPLARRAYFDRFERVLLNRTRRALAGTLEELPDNPTLDERDRVYNALKAHVEMTDAPSLADSSFFGPVLAGFWAGRSVPSEAVSTLARAQFAFYGHELQFGNPYPVALDELQVLTARAFLAANTSEDSFYQGLIGEANRLPAVALAREAPATEPYILSTVEVPGAYTRTGWDVVMESLGNADRFFNRDLHVVGNQFHLALDERGIDPDQLAVSLRARYEADYAAAWAAFLEDATVVRHGLSQSERRLMEYGDPQSALFRMLALVEENTRGTSDALESVFASVHLLTGPDTLAQAFSPEFGAPYLERLRRLGLAAGELGRSPGSSTAQDGLRGAATDGLQFVGNVQVAMPSEPRAAADVSSTVGDILRSPFEWARSAADQGSSIAVNSMASEFCSGDGRVLRLYPFRSGVAAATIDQVDAFFNPESGSAYEYFERVEAVGPLNARYRAFKDGIESVTSTLYPGDAESPTFRIQVNFDGRDPIELNIDGRLATFTAVQRAGSALSWDGSRAERVSLIVQSAGRPEPLEFNGTWAIFQLFHQAEWEITRPGTARVRWDGLGISGDVRFQGEPILQRGYFDAIGCPTRIAM